MVSSGIFTSLDHYLWQLLYKWATWSHPNKPKSWIVDRYFGKLNKFRNDNWVFGRDSDAYLAKFSWTSIVRHVMVKGGSSPDDPGPDLRKVRAAGPVTCWFSRAKALRNC